MHNNLKQHLIETLNNELIDKKTINEAEGEKKSWWSLAGGFFSKFLNPSKDDEKDPITKELIRQEKEAEAAAEKREKDLLSAKENAAAQKLAAKFEAKQNKLTLANKRKIDAWNEQKRKAEKAKEYWKSNSVERSQAEMDAWEKEFDEQNSALEANGYDSDQEEYRDLLYIVAFDKDGNPRTENDIREIMSKNDNLTDEEKELQSQAKRLTELTKKHEKEIANEIKENGEGFQKILEKVQTTATKKSDAETALKDAEKGLKEYNDRTAAINAINKKIEDSKEAEDKKNKAKDKKDKFENPAEDSSISFNNEEVSFKDGAIFDGYINELWENNEIGGESKLDDKVKKIQKALTDAGYPSKIVNKITTTGEFDTDITINDITNKINELSDDEKSSIQESVTAKLKENYAKAKQEYNSAEAKFNEVKFTKEDINNDNDSYDEEFKKHLEIYKTITSEDIDAGTYTDPKVKKEIEDKVKEAKDNFDNIKAEEKQRKEQRKDRRNRYESNRTNSTLPDEIKNKVSELKDELKPGEEYVEIDGKLCIGYIDENGKPHAKPKIGKNTDKENEYQNGLNKSLIFKKSSNVDGKKMTKIEGPDSDGKYKVQYSDGTEETGLNVNDVAMKKANYEKSIEARNIADKNKAEIAKALTDCLDKDGKIDSTKFNKLTDEQKSAISDISNLDDSKLEELFGDLEMGNDTLKGLKKALDEKSGLEMLLDADSEDVEDEEADDDDKEYEEDDENTGKLGGDEVVKIGDKWYKKSDIGDDGKPNEGTALSDDDVRNITKNKIKLQNPAKIWKRKKKKNSTGMTKSYYRKNKQGEWESITSDEYKQKMEAYKKAKQKATQDNNSLNDNTNLKNLLLDSLRNKVIENKYSKLKKYLTNNIQ